MKRAEEVRAEHKLEAITHYLLKAFPGAAIALHRAHRGDYLVTSAPVPLRTPICSILPRLF